MTFYPYYQPYGLPNNMPHYETHGMPSVRSSEVPYYGMPMHYHQPGFVPYAPNQNWDARQYPPVDTQQLDDSVQRFQKLLKQAELLIDQLANSNEFARELMSAAQASNKKRVEQLIRSTGVTINIIISFTPSGIRIELNNVKHEGDCCRLLIALKW